MSIGLTVQEEKLKTDFQDGGRGIRFLIGTILAICDLHVIPVFPTKFPVS